MQRHVLPLIMICAVLFGVFFTVMHIPVVSERVITDLAGEYLPGIGLENFHVSSQSYSLPDTVILHGVRFRVKKYGHTYNVRVHDMTFENVITDWKTYRRVKIHFVGTDADGDGGAVRQLSCLMALGFQADRLKSVDGIFKSGKMRIAVYRLTNVIGRFRANHQTFEMFDMGASAYGGKVGGQFALEYDAFPSYVLWVEFRHFQAKRLEDVSPFLFGRVSGLLDGHIRLNGSPRRLDILDIALAGRDLLIAPSVFKQLETLLPDKKKNELMPLSEGTKPLRIGGARLQIQNITNQKAQMIYAVADSSTGLVLRESTTVFIQKGWLPYLLKP